METLASVSRRDLLRSGGALIVSFSLGGRIMAQSGVTEMPKPLDPHEVDSFLAFHADGSITLYTSKVDVGTGLRIALPQMAAEELGLPVGRIAMVEGDTLLTPDSGGTGGSTGIPRGGVEVRQAAATARLAILDLGARELGRPVSELTLAGGEVRPIAGGKGVSIGALVNGRRLSLKIDPKAPLRDPLHYTVVGKPLARPDVPAKCTGRLTYVQDFTLPGMWHGRVVRPPAIGARLLSVDEASVGHLPGVRVVRIENFLGVVSSDEWAAVRAARELKAQWSEWQGLPGSDQLAKHVRSSAIDRDDQVVNRGNAASALEGSARRFAATYQWPAQSHASLGPSCAVADVKAGGATIWTSTQGTHGLRNTLAKLFGMPRDKVRAVYLDGSGSYGGNGNDDAAADAALLSKAVGKPVRVQWMRHDEHGWDPKGPPQLLDLRAGVDAQGRLTAWETEMWVPTTRPGGRPMLGPEAAGMTHDRGQSTGLMTQNGDPPYAVPHVRVVAHLLQETPLRPSNLRAPGKIANVFAVESFTDEIAAAQGVDAVEFRLRGLSDARSLEVIRRAARMIGWQARPSPNRKGGPGRGLAYVRYKQAENYVAIAMEVEVDRSSGRIGVWRVACAHDCGLVINPDALRNQVEGNILQTLSRALHEEVKFDTSHVTSVDWVSYPILRFPEAPAVQVELVDHPELPPLGAGEASSAPVAAALANAIFDASGLRLRTVPFTAARVKAAAAEG